MEFWYVVALWLTGSIIIGLFAGRFISFSNGGDELDDTECVDEELEGSNT